MHYKIFMSLCVPAFLMGSQSSMAGVQAISVQPETVQTVADVADV